ncbi:MAG: chemotaxis protein CheX [bacterium]
MTNSNPEKDLIHDFIEVTAEVLSTMASFEVKAEAIHEINSHLEDSTSCLDITGVLGFSGGRKGSLLVTFPESIALRAVGGMLGIEYHKVSADVRDGVSELVNMIAGGAKTRLQAKGIDFSLSIPNTVVGVHHQITGAASTVRRRVDFATELGRFFIEVYLKEE